MWKLRQRGWKVASRIDITGGCYLYGHSLAAGKQSCRGLVGRKSPPKRAVNNVSMATKDKVPLPNLAAHPLKASTPKRSGPGSAWEKCACKLRNRGVSRNCAA